MIKEYFILASKGIFMILEKSPFLALSQTPVTNYPAQPKNNTQTSSNQSFAKKTKARLTFDWLAHGPKKTTKPA